jgi:hypothetical protein
MQWNLEKEVAGAGGTGPERFPWGSSPSAERRPALEQAQRAMRYAEKLTKEVDRDA